MAYWYRASRNTFELRGAQNEITETQYGYAASGGFLLYPGVNTCTTITLLLNDNSVVGMHFAKGDPAAEVDAIVAEVNNHRAGQAVTHMYAVGVLRCRLMDKWMGEPRYGWPTLLNTFNTAFGRGSGDAVRGYIQPEDDPLTDYRAVATTGTISWSTRKTGTQEWKPLQLKGL